MAVLAIETNSRQSTMTLRQSATSAAALAPQLSGSSNAACRPILRRPIMLQTKGTCVMASNHHQERKSSSRSTQLSSVVCPIEAEKKRCPIRSSDWQTSASLASTAINNNHHYQKPASFWTSSTSLATATVSRARDSAIARVSITSIANVHQQAPSRRTAVSVVCASAANNRSAQPTKTTRQEQARRGRHLANKTNGSRRASCDIVPIIHSRQQQVSNQITCLSNKTPATQQLLSATTNSRLRQGALHARRQVHLQPRNCHSGSTQSIAASSSNSVALVSNSTTSQQRQQLASTLHKQRLRRGASLLAVTPDFAASTSSVASSRRSALVAAIRHNNLNSQAAATTNISNNNQMNASCQALNNGLELDCLFACKQRPTSKLTSSTSSLTLAVVKRPRQNPSPGRVQRPSLAQQHHNQSSKGRRWSAGIGSTTGNSSCSSRSSATSSSSLCSILALMSNNSSIQAYPNGSGNIRATSENRTTGEQQLRMESSWRQSKTRRASSGARAVDASEPAKPTDSPAALLCCTRSNSAALAKQKQQQQQHEKQRPRSFTDANAAEIKPALGKHKYSCANTHIVSSTANQEKRDKGQQENLIQVSADKNNCLTSTRNTNNNNIQTVSNETTSTTIATDCNIGRLTTDPECTPSSLTQPPLLQTPLTTANIQVELVESDNKVNHQTDSDNRSRGSPISIDLISEDEDPYVPKEESEPMVLSSDSIERTEKQMKENDQFKTNPSQCQEQERYLSQPITPLGCTQTLEPADMCSPMHQQEKSILIPPTGNQDAENSIQITNVRDDEVKMMISNETYNGNMNNNNTSTIELDSKGSKVMCNNNHQVSTKPLGLNQSDNLSQDNLTTSHISPSDHQIDECNPAKQMLTIEDCSLKNVADIPIRLEPISNHYDLESRPFARGKFAQVKRCVRKDDSNQCYAAKCIRKRRRQNDIRHEILLEIEALKLSYQTKYIVKLYEVFETPSEMILVLEMAKGGELQRVLDDEEQLDEKIVCRYIRQILDGLIFLHDNQIAHLDIKPQNLLLTEPFPNGDIKLCDFGISRRITEGCEIRDICGTPDYVAPEILRYDPISLATDMWSLGVLAYVLLSGYSPFGSENKQQTFCNITQGALDFPQEIFGKISPSAIDFVRKLIVREPQDRLTSRQARKHVWLTS